MCERCYCEVLWGSTNQENHFWWSKQHQWKKVWCFLLPSLLSSSTLNRPGVIKPEFFAWQKSRLDPLDQGSAPLQHLHPFLSSESWNPVPVRKSHFHNSSSRWRHVFVTPGLRIPPKKFMCFAAKNLSQTNGVFSNGSTCLQSPSGHKPPTQPLLIVSVGESHHRTVSIIETGTMGTKNGKNSCKMTCSIYFWSKKMGLCRERERE